jgi:hypothetical protein
MSATIGSTVSPNTEQAISKALEMLASIVNPQPHTPPDPYADLTPGMRSCLERAYDEVFQASIYCMDLGPLLRETGFVPLESQRGQEILRDVTGPA